MKVLSLFDGISCGRVALERANIPVDVYYASEVDKYAIQVSQKNYPDIIQLGDVTEIKYQGKIANAWSTFVDSSMEIDLLIGGSPCQDLSNYKYDRGEVKGLDGEKSNLFYHFVRLLKETHPRYFILENVASMEQKWVDVISRELGVQPVMINSALVCAAERKRLYWVGERHEQTNLDTNEKRIVYKKVEITQPEDRNINLKDICLGSDSVPEKYWYTKYDVVYNGMDKKVEATILLNGHRQSKEVYNLDFKCNTLLCDGNGGNLVKKIYQKGRVRKLTPLEYERLQTLPDNYTDNVSDSRRYSAIGNGWTVDVVAHILSFLTPSVT